MSEEKLCECRKMSVEGMRRDLLGGGWEPSCGGSAWTAPWGLMLRGPSAAWHYWAGIPKCDFGKVKQ